MPRKKITLGYIKEKIAKTGLDGLTPDEARALTTYKKLGDVGGKSKPESPKNIIAITPDIDITGEDDDGHSLDWFRKQLDSVQRLCWDKCIQGLNSNKAQGKWTDFMRMLQELKSYVLIASDNAEMTLDFDVVATREVAANTTEESVSA